MEDLVAKQVAGLSAAAAAAEASAREKFRSELAKSNAAVHSDAIVDDPSTTVAPGANQELSKHEAGEDADSDSPNLKMVDEQGGAEAAAQAIAAAEAAQAEAAAAAEAASAAKLRAKEREQWLIDNNVLRREARPQRLDKHDFVYFVSNRNAEEYPCVVVKEPQPLDLAATESEVASKAKGKSKKQKKKQPVDKNPTLFEVLYYDRTKENPLELNWEAIAIDSFVAPPAIYVPVWDSTLERELDARREAAAAVIQRRFRAHTAFSQHQSRLGAARAIQRFVRARVQAWVQRRRAEEFARQPVAYRLLIVDEQLESLLELKARAVRLEQFDEAHDRKLELESKRQERDRYAHERDGYIARIKGLAEANDALAARKREAVSQEDYLFAKEIKLEMERNDVELASCLRQTNLTEDYVRQMRENAQKRVLHEDKVIRKAKKEIMKRAATRGMKRYRVFVKPKMPVHGENGGIHLRNNTTEEGELEATGPAKLESSGEAGDTRDISQQRLQNDTRSQAHGAAPQKVGEDYSVAQLDAVIDDLRKMVTEQLSQAQGPDAPDEVFVAALGATGVVKGEEMLNDTSLGHEVAKQGQDNSKNSAAPTKNEVVGDRNGQAKGKSNADSAATAVQSGLESNGHGASGEATTSDASGTGGGAALAPAAAGARAARDKKLAEWKQLDKELKKKIKTLEGAKAQVTKLQAELDAGKLSKKEKKTKAKEVKEATKVAKALEKDVKKGKKEKKERDKQRPAVEFDGIHALVHGAGPKKAGLKAPPKLFKKLIEAKVTDLKKFLGVSASDLEKKFGLKAKVAKALRKAAKDAAKARKKEKELAKNEKISSPVPGSGEGGDSAVAGHKSAAQGATEYPDAAKAADTKGGTREPTAKDQSGETPHTKPAPTVSSEKIRAEADDDEDDPSDVFAGQRFEDLSSISEQRAMLVAFASLERAMDNSFFGIALSPACVDFLAKHDSVLRLEVVTQPGDIVPGSPAANIGASPSVGGDDWEDSPIQRRKQRGDASVLDGPAPWSISTSASLHGQGHRFDGQASQLAAKGQPVTSSASSNSVTSNTHSSDEFKQSDVESKINTVAEQRRARHRRRRLEKEAAQAAAEATAAAAAAAAEAAASAQAAAAARAKFEAMADGASEVESLALDVEQKTGGVQVQPRTLSSPSRAIESKLMDLVTLT